MFRYKNIYCYYRNTDVTYNPCCCCCSHRCYHCCCGWCCCCCCCRWKMKIDHPDDTSQQSFQLKFHLPPSQKRKMITLMFGTGPKWTGLKNADKQNCGMKYRISLAFFVMNQEKRYLRLEEISKSATMAWNDLYYWWLDPETWANKIDLAMKYFSYTMAQKYPEFRWCHGDWKVQEFATNCYPGWNRYHRQSGQLKCK